MAKEAVATVAWVMVAAVWEAAVKVVVVAAAKVMAAVTRPQLMPAPQIDT